MSSSSSTRFDVVVVGSANLDLVARTSRLPKPGETVSGSHFFEACGGKGVNQAIASARAGARTAFVGALGRDHAGETLLAALVKDGVDVSAVQRVSAPTGRALIGVSDDGENSIIVVPGANHAISIDDIEKHKSLISSAKVLLCQLEVPLSVVQRAFELAGPSTKRILNPAPAQTLSNSLLGVIDIVTPNEHEVERAKRARWSLTKLAQGRLILLKSRRLTQLVRGMHFVACWPLAWQLASQCRLLFEQP